MEVLYVVRLTELVEALDCYETKRSVSFGESQEMKRKKRERGNSRRGSCDEVGRKAGKRSAPSSKELH
jgi:hypothetical protein